MQRQFFQVFRSAFNLFKGVIYIVFMIALGIDLSHVHTLLETGIVVAAVLAALLLFDPLVEILLMVSLIALVVLVAPSMPSQMSFTDCLRCLRTTRAPK